MLLPLSPMTAFFFYSPWEGKKCGTLWGNLQSLMNLYCGKIGILRLTHLWQYILNFVSMPSFNRPLYIVIWCFLECIPHPLTICLWFTNSPFLHHFLFIQIQSLNLIFKWKVQCWRWMWRRLMYTSISCLQVQNLWKAKWLREVVENRILNPCKFWLRLWQLLILLSLMLMYIHVGHFSRLESHIDILDMLVTCTKSLTSYCFIHRCMYSCL